MRETPGATATDSGQGATEPGAFLAEVTDAEGVTWTRYHTDPTGHGRHWWSFNHGWAAFEDLDSPHPVSAGGGTDA